MLEHIEISLKDFSYELPESFIARQPANPRDQSRLLVYRQARIKHHRFHEIGQELDKGTYLVCNNTRVIPARLFFQRQTGALIEILPLEPHTPFEVEQAMRQTGKCIWQCMVGRKKRWKHDEELSLVWEQEGKHCVLKASWVDRDKNIIVFSWDPENIPFADVLQATGSLPLPPYMKRENLNSDFENYQTVFAREKGAVAAPTAGLHFTEELLSRLKQTGIEQIFVTLHVGGGTFLPVKSENVSEHEMHSEQILISKEKLEQLISKKENLIAVGTTSMRLLESLYWLGVKCLADPATFATGKMPHLPQTFPYEHGLAQLPKVEQAWQALHDFLIKSDQSHIWATTQLYILPGYTFRTCKGLITNFHLPESTLIMLVSALIGDDWKKVYEEALVHQYRFLSYGDASLLIP